MPIEVEVNGEILEFPDGTPDVTIQGVIRRQLAGAEGAPGHEPEPPKPGVAGSFGRGLAESVPFAGSADEGAGAALGATPGRAASFIKEQLSPDPNTLVPDFLGGKHIPRALLLPQKLMGMPIQGGIAAIRKLAALGGRALSGDTGAVAEAPEVLARSAVEGNPAGDIIADLAEKGGEAAGTNTPEAYARLAGNIGGLAAQGYVGGKLPKIAAEARAGAAAIPELPIIKNLADAKRAIETHKLKQRGARFERKYGDVVKEARTEKLLDRPAREAAAAEAEAGNAADLKRIAKETDDLKAAQAAERRAKVEEKAKADAEKARVEAEELKRDIDYRTELDKAKAQERRQAKEAELAQLKERIKTADQISKEQGAEAAKTEAGRLSDLRARLKALDRDPDPQTRANVELADQISRAQADEVAKAAKGKAGQKTISSATGKGNKKVDASSPSTEPKPAPSAAATEAAPAPKGQFPKLQAKSFRDLSQQLAESLGQGKPAAASPHAARLDEALAGIPAPKGPRTPQGEAFRQARKKLEVARRNIERAARAGAAESDIAAMVDEALSAAGISAVQ